MSEYLLSERLGQSAVTDTATAFLNAAYWVVCGFLSIILTTLGWAALSEKDRSLEVNGNRRQDNGSEGAGKLPGRSTGCGRSQVWLTLLQSHMHQVSKVMTSPSLPEIQSRFWGAGNMTQWV